MQLTGSQVKYMRNSPQNNLEIWPSLWARAALRPYGLMGWKGLKPPLMSLLYKCIGYLAFPSMDTSHLWLIVSLSN